MAENQMCGRVGWRRHRAMVMPAMLFMLRERVLLAEEFALLSAEDIAWMIEFYLPRPQSAEAEVPKALALHHQRR